MKFNASLARLMRDELKDAKVEDVSHRDLPDGDCAIYLRLPDGRLARVTASGYVCDPKYTSATTK